MDLIKQQYFRMMQQLAGLTATQKMLVFSLLAVMGLTLVMWMRFAADSERVALFDAPMSQSDLANVTMTLRSLGIEHEVSGGQVMVAEDKREIATAMLLEAQAVPGTVLNSFEQMFAQSSSWEGESRFAERVKQARSGWVAYNIRLWQNVASASVQITPAERRGLREFARPSASVNVRTKGNISSEQRQRMANAIAVLINGLVPMSRVDMGVVIDGEPMKLRDASDAMACGAEIAEHQSRVEQEQEAKIRDHFREVANLRVLVRAELNTTTKTEVRKEVDPTKKVQIAAKESTDSVEQSDAAPPAEPGALPNQGLDINAPGIAVTTNNQSREETQNIVDYSQSQTTIQTPAGDFKVTGVSLRVPRSHFVDIWRSREPANTPPEQQPTDAQLAEIERTTLDQMRQSLLGVIKVEPANAQVLAYFDVPNNGPGGVGSDDVLVASSAGGMPVLLTRYARELAIGLLAVASLFMVTRMVKKSVPSSPTLPSPKESPGPPELDAGRELAGIAGEVDNILTGREIDASVVAAKQMIDQVQTLVKENPDAAASLVKKWLVRG